MSIRLMWQPKIKQYELSLSLSLSNLNTCIGRIARNLATILFIASTNVAFAVPEYAPYITSREPLRDQAGRIAVIVDIRDTATDIYPESVDAATKQLMRFARSGNFHRGNATNLVADYEKKYGFVHEGMTSHVGTSFTAYLHDDQIQKLRKDKNVLLISQDAIAAEFSSQPPWVDNPEIPNGGEMHSWGRVAVNGKDKIPGSTRRVFVIDSGVAYHNDLTNVTIRTSVACGSQGGCENVSSFNQVVGCYSHATHVAGIIGAVNGNGATSAGVYAGVDITSVTPYKSNFLGNNCAQNGTATTATFGWALDYVYNQIWKFSGGKFGIVNLSLNGPTVALGTVLDASGNRVSQTNAIKLKVLATPALTKDSQYRRYPGALVVQSAGNHNSNVCTVTQTWGYAYIPGTSPNQALSDDGIMVVGAVNRFGRAVAASEPFSATSPPNLTQVPPASNFGACVDIWAPGDRILSTWGPHSGDTYATPTEPYSGNAPNGSQGWAFLSGTSMAAPHVVGVAAYLADAYNVTSPAALEQLIRSNAVQYNLASDAANVPVKVVRIP